MEMPDPTFDLHMKLPCWVRDAASAQGLPAVAWILRAIVRLHEGKLTAHEAREKLMALGEHRDADTEAEGYLRAQVRQIASRMMVD